MLWRKAVFIVLIVFCLSPLGSPAAALILGLALALTIGDSFPQLRARPTYLIFQISVILLGLNTDIRTLYQTTKGGLPFVITIVLVMAAGGYIAGRFAGESKALLSPVASHAVANGEESPVATYLVFLSALFLAVSPFVGRSLALTPLQFGAWSAVSVPFAEPAVGAPLAINADSVNVGTALVLVRALLLSLAAWIYSRIEKETSGSSFPWFVPVFVLVVVFRTYAPTSIFPSIFDAFVNLGNAGVLLTLFLIGAGVSPLASNTWRTKPIVIVSGIWIVLAGLSLWAILRLL